MFLHLGGDAVVHEKSVIAVFDMDNTTISRQSRHFLNEAQRRGEVMDVTEDLPKSYIVTRYRGKTKVYISSISSATLAKRAKSKQINLR